MDYNQKMLIIELKRFRAEMHYQFLAAEYGAQKLRKAQDTVGESFFVGKAKAYKRAYDLISNAMFGIDDKGEQR